MPPLSAPGLYVHIPFCLSRCGYCAFTSGRYDRERADRYLAALAEELRAREAALPEGRPATLFLGGGTPSCLSPAQWERLLALLPFPRDGEATCELNPDSATPDKLAAARRRGVNRCSFGVQTFSEAGLKLLERRHDAATAVAAVAGAVRMGFSSVGLDLIVGWPGQTERELRRDLETAADLGVRHVSCYQLTLEEGSAGYRRLGPLMAEVSETALRKLWDVCEEVLEARGFVHYETSNFARPGFVCRHNRDVWEGGEYLGLGLSAHSHLGGRRFANTADIDLYTASAGKPKAIEVFSERLEPAAKARECAVFWLRLFEGIDIPRFQKRTGFNFFTLYGKISYDLFERGLLERVNDSGGTPRVRVPKRLHPVLDAILVDLV